MQGGTSEARRRRSSLAPGIGEGEGVENRWTNRGTKTAGSVSRARSQPEKREGEVARRKTATAKRRAGNPGRRPLRWDAEPSPGRPERPEWLDPVGLDMWERTVAHLESLGLLFAVDEAAIALLADVWAKYRETRDWKLAVRVQSLLSEFGLTPRARAGLKIEPPRPRDPVAERFFS